MKRTLLLLSALSACSGEDVAAPTSEQPDAPPQAACPAAKGPTMHDSTITADEVWTAAGSPHVVSGTVTVRGGAKLTIEPCATVELAARATLVVGFQSAGTLVAEGSAERPIKLVGRSGARWGSLEIQTLGSARLAYVTLENGGDGAPSGATIDVTGNSEPPSTHPIAVDHVTVKGSSGAGVRLIGSAAFAPGSTALTVTGAGGSAVELDELAIDTMPDGSYTGNKRDELWIIPQWPLREDATLRDLGVRWHSGNWRGGTLVVGRGAGYAPTTLTIEPGVTLAFDPGTGLDIEHTSGEQPASGVLVAVGTPSAPIVFTSAAATPAPGDWRGLWFGGVARAENRLENVRIEYSGGDCGCVLATCTPGVTFTRGAVIFTRKPPSAFVTDSVIAHGDGHGFVLGYDGEFVDLVSGNRFEDLLGCNTTMPRQAVCPVEQPACH